MAFLDPKTAPSVIGEVLSSYKELIEAELVTCLKSVTSSHPAASKLLKSMQHSTMAGGKRLRPALVLASAEALGGKRKDGIHAALAIELLHGYTLVHDDLPAMDDDDLRRGKPTVHIAFDEATAILCGDALCTLAFAELSKDRTHCADLLSVLSSRSGAKELLAGQMMDLELLGKKQSLDFETLLAIHRGKTGALFAAATEMGAICAGVDTPTRQIMADVGMSIGIAFQHADDIDDGDFVAFREQANADRIRLARDAISKLEKLVPSDNFLIEICRWIGRES